jgi:hypothetical protein
VADKVVSKFRDPHKFVWYKNGRVAEQEPLVIEKNFVPTFVFLIPNLSYRIVGPGAGSRRLRDRQI